MTAVTPPELAQAPSVSAIEQRVIALEAARRYAGKSRADNTWRGYRGAWQRFETWCQGAALVALPATPPTVAMFEVRLTFLINQTLQKVKVLICIE